MPLCTIGYEKRSLDEYLDLLLEHGVEVVVDVRETAWSHKPGFSKTAAGHAECLHLYRGYVDGHPDESRRLAIVSNRLKESSTRITAATVCTSHRRTAARAELYIARVRL